MLLAVFTENVRHLVGDETVRSFAWLCKACQDCVERWQKRQNTLLSDVPRAEVALEHALLVNGNDTPERADPEQAGLL